MAGFKRRATAHEAHVMRDKAAEIATALAPPDAPREDLSTRDESALNAAPRAPVGSIIEVAVKSVRENPYNARTMLTTSSIDEMAMSLLEGGQKAPAAAFYDSDGVVTLIDGHRRLKGLMAIGKSHIRVEIRPEPQTPLDKYIESRKFNIDREDQTPIDDAIAWKRLLAQGIVQSQDEIVVRLGVSKGTVSKIMSLADLPGAITAALVEHRDLLGLTTLYEIYLYWKAAGDERTLELVAEAANRGFSRREIEARRKSVERGPRAKPRSQRWKFSFGGATGMLRRFDQDGRVELRIQGLNSEDLQALETKLAEFVAAEPELPL